MDRIQSAAFQKDRARKKAFANWEREFGLERCLAQFKLRWPVTQVKVMYSASASLQNPPLSGHHALWAAATEVKKDENGKKTRIPKYSRHTTSAALQLAVDHAFTGSYARRFRPADPPETTACALAEQLPDLRHISFGNAHAYFNTASMQEYTRTIGRSLWRSYIPPSNTHINS
jgi:hypothetical protein